MIEERDFVPKKRNIELISVKPEPIIYLAGQGDFVPKEEENSKDVAQCFFDNRVGL